MNQDETKIINYIFGKYFLSIMGFFTFAGIVMYIISTKLIQSSSLADPLKQLAVIIWSVVFVSVIHEKVLGDYYQHQAGVTNKIFIEPQFENLQSNLTKKMDEIIPNMQNDLSKKMDEIILNMENDLNEKMDEIIPNMQNNLSKNMDDIVPNMQNSLNQKMNEIIPNMQNSLNQKMDEIIPSIQKTIEAEVGKVNDATNAMIKGIDVLSGANEAGIVNVFPSRYIRISGKSAVDIIKEDLLAEKEMIKIIGISLGDYFLDRGELHTTFVRVLEQCENETKLVVKTLTLNPKCNALKVRAKWEVGPIYENIPDFYECTTFIETEGAAKIARRACNQYMCLQSRLYEEPPLAFVLLTSRFAFIEPYNYASRGSNVPLFQVQKDYPLYKNYVSHFDRIWDVAKPIASYNPL